MTYVCGHSQRVNKNNLYIGFKMSINCQNCIFNKVSVGHIVPGGSADLSGSIFTGDELISIDGQSTMKTSHDYVINLMGQASRNGQVTLEVRHMKSSIKPITCE